MSVAKVTVGCAAGFAGACALTSATTEAVTAQAKTIDGTIRRIEPSSLSSI